MMHRPAPASGAMLLSRVHVLGAALTVVVMLCLAFVGGLAVGQRAAVTALPEPMTLGEIDARARVADMMFHDVLAAGGPDVPAEPMTPLREQAEAVLVRALKSGPARPGEYSILIQDTGSGDAPEAMAGRMQRLGFRPLLSAHTDGGGEVHVGRFASRRQAERARRMLVRTQVRGRVVRIEP